jgi:hypothetical protein
VQGLPRRGDLAAFFLLGCGKGCKIGARVKSRARSANGGRRVLADEPWGDVAGGGVAAEEIIRLRSALPKLGWLRRRL